VACGTSATHLVTRGHPAPLQPEANGAAEATVATWADLAARAATVASPLDGRWIGDERLFARSPIGVVGLRCVAHDPTPNKVVKHGFEPFGPPNGRCGLPQFTHGLRAYVASRTVSHPSAPFQWDARACQSSTARLVSVNP
jgi:hypothetical protein